MFLQVAYDPSASIRSHGGCRGGGSEHRVLQLLRLQARASWCLLSPVSVAIPRCPPGMVPAHSWVQDLKAPCHFALFSMVPPGKLATPFFQSLHAPCLGYRLLTNERKRQKGRPQAAICNINTFIHGVLSRIFQFMTLLNRKMSFGACRLVLSGTLDYSAVHQWRAKQTSSFSPWQNPGSLLCDLKRTLYFPKPVG